MNVDNIIYGNLVAVKRQTKKICEDYNKGKGKCPETKDIDDLIAMLKITKKNIIDLKGNNKNDR